MAIDRRRHHFPIGQVLQLIAILLALWAATVRLENRIAVLETKIDPMWRWFTGATPSAPR